VSQKDAENRRQHRRVPASALPSLTARLSGGAAVKLLDVSRRGVRLETAMHMRPGQTVCIRFVAADATVTLTAAVVRATVAHVESGGIRYETALSLAGDLLLCDQLHNEAMQEPDLNDPAAVAPPSAGLSPVVDHTVVVRSGPDAPAMLEGLCANGW
jgi:hypothetical protein